MMQGGGNGPNHQQNNEPDKKDKMNSTQDGEASKQPE